MAGSLYRGASYKKWHNEQILQRWLKNCRNLFPSTGRDFPPHLHPCAPALLYENPILFFKHFPKVGPENFFLIR
jgi:hypothetical protein